MKTTINLSDYTFSGKNNPLYQISDHPTNKLVRVVEIDRAEMLFDIDLISIGATTYYINPELKVVVFKEETKLEGKQWNVVRNEFTIKVDENLVPIPNPDYKEEAPVSPENYPFELVDAYAQFKEILVQLNTPVLEVFINSNDEKKLFD